MITDQKLDGFVGTMISNQLGLLCSQLGLLCSQLSPTFRLKPSSITIQLQISLWLKPKQNKNCNQTKLNNKENLKWNIFCQRSIRRHEMRQMLWRILDLPSSLPFLYGVDIFQPLLPRNQHISAFKRTVAAFHGHRDSKNWIWITQNKFLHNLFFYLNELTTNIKFYSSNNQAKKILTQFWKKIKNEGFHANDFWKNNVSMEIK